MEGLPDAIGSVTALVTMLLSRLSPSELERVEKEARALREEKEKDEQDLLAAIGRGDVPAINLILSRWGHRVQG